MNWKSNDSRSLFIAFLSGVIFACGLSLSGMSNPRKVLAFLDVFGHWDPSLAFVMVGAIAVYFIAARAADKSARPLYALAWELPTKRKPNARLVLGAAIFGVGWGLSGLCPGPAVSNLLFGGTSIMVFFGSMLLGMAGFHLGGFGSDKR